MTNGGADRSVECTGNVQAMISAFECVHDVSSWAQILIAPFSLFQPPSRATMNCPVNADNECCGFGSGLGCCRSCWGAQQRRCLRTHPANFLSERTLKGTFFGNYKPRTDLPSVVEKSMNKVRHCILVGTG